MYGAESWELVGWSYEGNYSLSLTDEQVYAIFKVLGLKFEDLPNGKYQATNYSDEYLNLLRTKEE